MLKDQAYLKNTFSLLLAFVLANPAWAQDFQGAWQGYVHEERINRPYIFRITKGADGRWSANVIDDYEWGKLWKADSISIEGRHVKLTVPMFGGSPWVYDGHLSEDGKSIDGTWSSGSPVPLRMARATPETLWRETPHETRFITVEKNIRLEVLDWGGDGRPLVMVPGAGLTAHVFSQFAAELTPLYHVYGITPRGEGASSAPSLPAWVFTQVAPNTYELKPQPNNPYDADRLGDDIIAVLDALHIERPVLVGHSIAGEELTSVASRYPGRVAGLIYLDAFAEFAFSDGGRFDALFTDQHPMRVTLPPGKTPQPQPGDALLLGMHEYRHFPNVPALAIFALPHVTPGNVTTPAQLAAYKANQQRAMDRMERIKPLLPSVRIVNFTNADHAVWESNEADVLREMNAFIASLPR